MLGAYKSLDVLFWRDLEGLILYCVYGVSVPSLHRESTDSLIVLEQKHVNFALPECSVITIFMEMLFSEMLFKVLASQHPSL